MSERNAKNNQFYSDFFQQLNAQLGTVNTDLRDEYTHNRLNVIDTKSSDKFLEDFGRIDAAMDNMSDLYRGKIMYENLKSGKRIFVYDYQERMPREIRIGENDRPMLSEPISRENLRQKPNGLGFWKNVAHVITFGRAYKEEVAAYNKEVAAYKEDMTVLKRLERRIPAREAAFELEGAERDRKQQEIQEAQRKEQAAKIADAAKEAAAKGKIRERLNAEQLRRETEAKKWTIEEMDDGRKVYTNKETGFVVREVTAPAREEVSGELLNDKRNGQTNMTRVSTQIKTKSMQMEDSKN